MTINLSPSDENLKNFIASALSRPTKDQIDEIYEMADSSFTNGKHFLRWDILYTRLEDTNPSMDAIPVRFNRNIWEGTFLLDSSSSTLFVVLNQKRLERLEKNYGSKDTNYVYSLVGNFNPSIEEQEESTNGSLPVTNPLFDVLEEEDIQRRRYDCFELLGGSYSDVKKVILVTFELENSEVINLQANLFSSDFQKLETEDWSEFITTEAPAASAYLEDSLNKQKQKQNKASLVTLRKDTEKRQTEQTRSIVSPKKEEQQSSDDKEE